jgi:hypothetical protein
MARKLAILYWKLFMEGMEHVKEHAESYKKKLKERKQKNLKKLAKELNVQIIDNKMFV